MSTLPPPSQRRVSLGTLFHKLKPYFIPYRIAFFIAFLLILTSTAIDVFKPIVVGKAVDMTVDKTSQRTDLLYLCLLFISMISVRFLVDTVKGYLIQSRGQFITHKLRSDLFLRIQHFPVAYFDVTPVGRPLTRVVNDIKTLGEIFTASIAVIALDAILIVGTVTAMILLHWKLALVVLLGFPIILWSIHFFGTRLANAYRKARAKLSEINAFLGENIGAISTIQSLSAEKSRMESFKSITEDHFVAQMHSLKTYAKMQPLTNSVNGLSMASLLGFGGYWVIQGEITIGVLVAFIGYIRNLFVPLRDLVEKYNQLLSAQVSAERVVDLLSAPIEMPLVSEPPTPPPAKPMDLIFNRVGFTYPTRSQPALKEVSFSLPHGKSLAVVGATGSGKSSLIRLLMRFYEPSSGEILLGGKELSLWDKPTLRSNIGIVHQEIYLLEGTIRDNLALGTSSFEEDLLIQCAKKAQLWPVIENRGGLDAPVLEGGNNYSIGEKQLLSLARILVFNPPVLVLDEATASIDRISEARLMKAISHTLVGRTAIVIAHRLSTIESCDDILVLDEGKIVEQGNYTELLNAKGLFHVFHQGNQLT